MSKRTKRTLAAGFKAIFAGLVLMIFRPAIASESSSQTLDLSNPGPLAVETLEFRNLVDVHRSGHEQPVSRIRRLRGMHSQNKNLSVGKGRNVSIKVHIPAAGGPYPIVVVSHGAGGNWDSHYAQAQHLASHGYAVLCLEHPGSNTDRLTSSIRLMDNLNRMIRDADEVLGRPKDVSFAIDQSMEWNRSHDRLRGRLDSQHVGLLGHSFGACTTMVVCGVRPALNWLEPPVGSGRGLGPDFRDTRVSCGVALSPQGPAEPFFTKESFASLSAPLLGISGDEDRQHGGLPPINRYMAFSLWPRKQGQHKFVWLANAHHLDFTDPKGAEKRGFRSANREDVQAVVRVASLSFFNTYLKADRLAAENLTTRGLQAYLRGNVDKVEVRSK